jgi:hypothetical protein
MTIQSQIRLVFAAVTLLAGFSLLPGGLAQDASRQSNPDTASSPAKANASGPSYLEPLNAGETVGVLGKNVVARNGEGLGLITDVIVDRTGQPRAAVIDFGGFLGVGSRKIAVDWNLLSFDPEKRERAAVLALRRHEIRAAPEYRGDATSVEMVGPPLVGSSSGDAGK